MATLPLSHELAALAQGFEQAVEHPAPLDRELLVDLAAHLRRQSRRASHLESMASCLHALTVAQEALAATALAAGDNVVPFQRRAPARIDGGAL